MDNRQYQDEFEQFLQDEVKQHRMYPSDNIWKNIRMELHGYRAWPALTFISLFIITALTISTLLNNHPDRHTSLPPVAVIAQGQANTSNNTTSDNSDNANVVADNNYFHKIATEQITAETFAGLNETVPQETIIPRNTGNDYAAVPVRTANTGDHTSSGERTVTKTLPVDAINKAPGIQNTFVATAAKEENSTTASPAVEEEKNVQPSVDQKKSDTHSSADDFLKDFGYMGTTRINSQKRSSKFGFQFYITPSTSYRRLSDDQVKDVIIPAAIAAAAAQNVPLTTNISTDVNNVVRHKPAIGFEAGFALLYNMSGRLKFKTGIQLNVRQYYIETFQSTNDLSSLSLINYRGIETISFYSPYNNNTGYSKAQLDNRVYQLSVPLGIEWDVLQGKHFGFNTEASVQPTFTLNDNTYLLSTDYKHYTSGNEYLRKWNINTSVGFNLTYRSGATTWQLGPQVRYQHLPTYTNLYPVKEYLVDYGIRLGITHQIR